MTIILYKMEDDSRHQSLYRKMTTIGWRNGEVSVKRAW